ncbi:molybdenum-pterin-binding domain-containing protein [Gloeocapsopsis sp. IPPAS B-1203]|uniref:molybdenum-pterin-binding domain-containing protein n=1 Tax=Gloeocapsopsis sp. IPPAS B-1203 TaxID=2049454 RepID=UPI0025A14C57|nr:molybdenum-pterin-binding domain-containing protein [Gloeocapsopsis sp. IPPAS B-1203]
MSNKQKQWITFKVSEMEMSALEAYCQRTERTKTDVLRELIRKLPTYTNSSNRNILQ